MATKNKLTKDIFSNIGLNLKFSDLMKFCQCNRLFHQISKDDNFWKQYLYLNFLVETPIKELTFKETTKIIYNFLTLTRKDHAYIPFKSFIKFLNLPLNIIRRDA